MLKRYFKVAWRNLLKDRHFTLLNLLGLSTGLACTILVYLWVSDELNIDKFNEKDSRLFQVMRNSPPANGVQNTDRNPWLPAPILVKELPEVEHATSVDILGIFHLRSY